MKLLTSDLAYNVFVPSHWTGIDMEPYHLDVKHGLPDHLKARSRQIRESLYHDAKKEFDRMSSYFYEKSSSAIASPLVVAPKATAPSIRLCVDYRPINSYVCIPQEPIPHVQQTLAKAAGWKIFVDLDMTNSFHQIPTCFLLPRSAASTVLSFFLKELVQPLAFYNPSSDVFSLISKTGSLLSSTIFSFSPLIITTHSQNSA